MLNRNGTGRARVDLVRLQQSNEYAGQGICQSTLVELPFGMPHSRGMRRVTVWYTAIKGAAEMLLFKDQPDLMIFRAYLVEILFGVNACT